MHIRILLFLQILKKLKLILTYVAISSVFEKKKYHLRQKNQIDDFYKQVL